MALYSPRQRHLSGKVRALEGLYIIYCCVELPPNLGACDGINISHSFCGLGIWGQLTLVVLGSHEVVLEMLARAVATGKLDQAGGSTSKVAHSHVWRDGAGCWRQASVRHHVDPHGAD